MKVYMNDTSLRMVGKSWQIRAKLQELSHSTLTVQQFIQYSKSNKQMRRKQELGVVRSTSQIGPLH